MLHRLLLLAALVLAPLAGGAALAHQQKIAISTIALNARSGAIEIAHQVPVHDAEHALRAQGAKSADIIGSEKSREAFARYVTRRFLLQVDGKVVEPAYVGSEITGGSLWVYQEVPAPSGGQAVLRFNSQILTDVWARQENRVNIGGGTKVNTFIFRAGSVPADAPLTP
ncbi:DUF6702 family protein [Porphyrobacter sp. CACIAM 03H1]|uniref:DUF6702 family protein n=1 Tax=Porphyrobacter sp. CACIAM 03H1 TaxID=2003315 RepID=UPI000B5A664A|nr:DUF6702 family protein [Porphyrobacter sp. CACIAM 03H1]ASJ90153.1 hypothetical protein CBR61_03890 [Porphyrobacter sp. CACIAM 03H1]